MNKVILLGHLGQDPELKDVNGVQICNFSLATNKQWTDPDGHKQESTEWHKITAFRKTAELAGKYLKKGRQVLIDGEIKTRSYEKDGEKKYITEIIANHFEFAGGINDGIHGVPAKDSIPADGF